MTLIRIENKEKEFVFNDVKFRCEKTPPEYRQYPVDVTTLNSNRIEFIPDQAGVNKFEIHFDPKHFSYFANLFGACWITIRRNLENKISFAAIPDGECKWRIKSFAIGDQKADELLAAFGRASLEIDHLKGSIIQSGIVKVSYSFPQTKIISCAD